jgi:type VI secretion system protein ImpC
MPKPLSFGRFEVGLTAGSESGEKEFASEGSMRILILGDFSGQQSRRSERPEIRERRPIVVDRDNLDQVIAKLDVELHLRAGDNNSRSVVRFRELEDFHPDRLYQRLELFQALRDLRSRLSDPSRFASASEELRGWSAARGEEPLKKTPEKKPSPPPANPEQLLEQILGGAPVESSSGDSFGSGDWQSYLRRIVEPHLAPKIDYSKQTQVVGLLDDVIGRNMRALLHYPPFQALESAWRSVDFVVRRVETDADLKLYLLDVTKSELLKDLEVVDNLHDSGLYRLLVESVIGVPGAVPWGLLLGHFTFGQNREEAEFLGRLAKICAKAGAPFVAGASSQLLGVDSLAQTPDPRSWDPERDPEGNAAWQALRRLPETSFLGLVLPRFLLRLPYGEDTNSTEQFEFEETAEGFGHESYLWGNPACVCGCLLAEAYARYGWGMRLGIFQDVEGLPLHSFEDRGEKEVKPCAEVLLTERALEPILEKGLMPLLSFQERDAVRLANFQSLAQPARALAGRWH